MLQNARTTDELIPCLLFTLLDDAHCSAHVQSRACHASCLGWPEFSAALLLVCFSKTAHSSGNQPLLGPLAHLETTLSVDLLARRAAQPMSSLVPAMRLALVGATKPPLSQCAQIRNSWGPVSLQVSMAIQAIQKHTSRAEQLANVIFFALRKANPWHAELKRVDPQPRIGSGVGLALRCRPRPGHL